jgi:hypothetical protein
MSLGKKNLGDSLVFLVRRLDRTQWVRPLVVARGSTDNEVGYYLCG